jgi:hypothetical protein
MHTEKVNQPLLLAGIYIILQDVEASWFKQKD